MRPLVSIITPTFNHASFIGQCIESVLGQSFQDWEQIIVDDGSQDNTLEVAQSYHDPRLRIYTQPNRGIAGLKESYNFGLASACGEYVAILEGDDYWLPDKLQKQVPLFDREEVGLVWGGVSWIREGEHITDAPPEIARFSGLDRYGYLRELLLDNFIPAVSVLIRKKTLLQAGGFQQPPYLVTVDYPTWLRCLTLGEAALTTDVVACWRRHSTQITSTREEELLDGTIRCACEFYRSLPLELQTRLALTPAEIAHNWNNALSLSCFNKGRKHLTERNWKLASHEFLRSLSRGGAPVRAKAALGMVGALAGFDLEGLARRLGKDSLDCNV